MYLLKLIQGKTLAFVLPILESLINGPTKAVRNTGYGRAPSVLVLLPTRELAKQVCHERFSNSVTYIAFDCFVICFTFSH